MNSGDIKYDELIVCLGSSTKYFNIPGADKYTLPIRSIYDASIIHDHISKIISEENKKHNIVIVGAGATGVSLGSALAETISAELRLLLLLYLLFFVFFANYFLKCDHE